MADTRQLRLYDIDDICYWVEKTLHDLHHHIIPNESYPLKNLSDLITCLIVNQRLGDTFIASGGHWSLIPTHEAVPSDVRVDFIFFPSYLIVSIPTLFWYRYKEEAKPVLHIIIRGMKNRDKIDIELSTRSGTSCDQNLVAKVKQCLQQSLG